MAAEDLETNHPARDRDSVKVTPSMCYALQEALRPSIPSTSSTELRRVAFLGNHLPRQCGIATFTSDLNEAVGEAFPVLERLVLAMNEEGHHHAYPEQVRFEVAASDVASYRRAADFLNASSVDVVSVQHEYGIFGGKAGSYVLTLLRELNAAIVTTLHTILSDPSELQRAAMDELTRLSERLVVMSEQGSQLIQKVHGVPASKIDVIPHGILNIPFSWDGKDRVGLAEKKVILTFGLLSPDKGIEYVIDAMPEVLTEHPDAVYVVLGATHPHVKERQGETYRSMLKTRAQKLGVSTSVIFHNRFVGKGELTEFLSAADIYITPYLQPEQSTSGTLAYAIGAGKAVISTPYLYARELLADGRGILVPWRDPSAIAREVNALLGSDGKRLALRQRAAEYGRSMHWPRVARSYVQSFEVARAEHADRARALLRAKALRERAAGLPEVSHEHLARLTDGTGILQHAAYSIPRYEDGYCLDDNARALLLTTLLEEVGTNDLRLVRSLGTRYLAFVNYALDAAGTGFNNFMSYDRTWEEGPMSEDGHGRALWALGTVIGRSEDPGRRNLAESLFRATLPKSLEFTSPRGWAYAILGVHEYLRVFRGESRIQSIRASLAERLLGLYRRTSTQDWPWFEDTATYCNARLSEALIGSGEGMGNEEMKTAGLASLRWLASVQCAEDGTFAPIGSSGFYTRGGVKSGFDQQPVEAASMVSACLLAARVSRDQRWTEEAQRAFHWFFGQNALQQSLYDPSTGGCRDGLHSDRPNENQGAESTLSFLVALVEMRAAEAAKAAELAS